MTQQSAHNDFHHSRHNTAISPLCPYTHTRTHTCTHTHTQLFLPTTRWWLNIQQLPTLFSHCTEVEFHCPPSLFFCPHPTFCLSLHTHTHTHTHSHFLSLWMMSCSPVLNLLPYDMVSCSAENIKTDCETQTDREWQTHQGVQFILICSWLVLYQTTISTNWLWKPAHGKSKVRVTRVCAYRWQQDSNYHFTHLGTCLVRCNLPNSRCNTVYMEMIWPVFTVCFTVCNCKCKCCQTLSWSGPDHQKSK